MTGTPLDPSKIRVRVNVWLENPDGEVVYGEGRQQILTSVASQGTLSAAAETLGMSYRGLWGRIRISEKRLGFPLLESHAGRGPSSGSTLTTEGKALMHLYASLRDSVRSHADEAYRRALEEEPSGAE